MIFLGLRPSDVFDAPSPSAPLNPQPESAQTSEGSPAPVNDVMPSESIPAAPPSPTSSPELSEGEDKSRAEPTALARYIDDHERSARSLLTGFQISKDRALLDEAYRTYPDDPIVLLKWAMHTPDGGEERIEALLQLGDMMPENAISYYLLGEEHLKQGKNSEALALLLAGSKQPVSTTFDKEFFQDAKAYWESTGLSTRDATFKAWTTNELMLAPGIVELVSSIERIHEEVLTLDQDEVSAEAWAIVGTRIASQLNEQNATTIIHTFTSINLERKFLNLLDPDTELGVGGVSVGERIQQLDGQEKKIKADSIAVDRIIMNTSPENQLRFVEIGFEQGEAVAWEWAKDL